MRKTNLGQTKKLLWPLNQLLVLTDESKTCSQCQKPPLASPVHSTPGRLHGAILNGYNVIKAQTNNHKPHLHCYTMNIIRAVGGKKQLLWLRGKLMAIKTCDLARALGYFMPRRLAQWYSCSLSLQSQISPHHDFCFSGNHLSLLLSEIDETCWEK